MLLWESSEQKAKSDVEHLRQPLWKKVGVLITSIIDKDKIVIILPVFQLLTSSISMVVALALIMAIEITYH